MHPELKKALKESRRLTRARRREDLWGLRALGWREVLRRVAAAIFLIAICAVYISTQHYARKACAESGGHYVKYMGRHPGACYHR